ncbi:hypothetical protein AJ78_03687 [Emergomyces pasteurianus Ep9510]|uniref:Uncharacterized protein n=1 Tax=Emergomyces pasteurianus Ep9510 TaxID=1447872 RepID=A0A1J9Q785_9EURO|nr:hypothetical protein AJ78_03687 [Emergomyces pasteurianus Ep9510]
MASHTEGTLGPPADPAADDGIKIIWEYENPRPKVQITNKDIIDAVSVPGRLTRDLCQHHPPGVIYHDLLNCNRSFAAAIRKIREALDRELDMMKTKNDMGKHYWMEVIYRRFLGSYRIDHVGESVLPAAEDSSTMGATLSGISPQDWGFVLRFASCDKNLRVAATFEDIQHLHRRGAIFLGNHRETETSGLDTHIDYKFLKFLFSEEIRSEMRGQRGDGDLQPTAGWLPYINPKWE